MSKAKSYEISKQIVWESYEQVKANKGAAGIDQCTIKDFESNLKNNLYKLWNRMSSGSYFPAPVQRVEIPKSDGGIRVLGIPTITDRIAQTVAKKHLEPALEQLFHQDSYGYRPNRSAHQALAVTQQRCWEHDWVIDLDIKGFFDNIPHELMMRAVKKHTQEPWIELYVERWLTAPIQTKEEASEARTQGTPQGGVISPLLANLFLHYAFDHWMQTHYPGNPFERYADDVIVHCSTESEALKLKASIAERLIECGLQLHPEKTKIAYCKDANRKLEHPVTSFEFLGYCFRPRLSRNRYGKFFVNFLPAISPKSKKAIYAEIKKCHFHRKSHLSVKELANLLNPTVRGWIQYFGAFYKSALSFLKYHIDELLYRWVVRKYKKHGANAKKVTAWIDRIKRDYPRLFAHWELFNV